MDNLILSLTNNSGLWESILNFLYSFIGNVGWVVIILTILIKLVLSPLDFLQKKSMKKMTAATTLLQPEMQKLQVKCGNNRELYNQKVQELYKKHNINPTSGCSTMFLYMILTSVIFITFFNCLRGVSTEQIVNQYNSLETVYTTAYNYYSEGAQDNAIEINGKWYKLRATDKNVLILNSTEYNDYRAEYDNAQDGSEIKQYPSSEAYALQKRVEFLSQKAVVEGITLYEKDSFTNSITLKGFNEIKQSFLWIKNIWRADHYNSVFPSANDFIKESGISFKERDFEVSSSYPGATETDGKYYVKGYYQTLDGTVITDAKEGKEEFIKTYNTVTKQINVVYDGWNGYLILVLLAAATTLLSTMLTSLGSKTRDKKGFEVNVKPQKNNLTMTLVLTALFVWITWSYTAAFALYIVTSSLIGIPISIGINYLINNLEKRQAERDEISYSRYKN